MFNGKLSLVFVIERHCHTSIQQLIDYPADDVGLRLEKTDGYVTASYAESSAANNRKVVGTDETIGGTQQGFLTFYWPKIK